MLACVDIFSLPVQVEQQRLKHTGPLLIGRRGKVYAASNDALAVGVIRAMRLFKARQLMPSADIVEDDESTYYERQAAAALALETYSDHIETLELGRFLIDVGALASFAGGYPALAQAIRRDVTETTGLAVHVGIAANRFTAEQAARQPDADGIRVIASGDEAAFLAPLPVAALPLHDLEHRRRLETFGVKSVGAFSMLPVAAVERQFGADVESVHAMARGKGDFRIHPDVPPLRDHRERQFDEPLIYRRAVIEAAGALAADLGEGLTKRGYHAESIRLRLAVEGGETITSDYALKPPTADPVALARRVREAVSSLELTGPISEIDVVTYPLRPWHLGAKQLDLFTNVSTKKAQIRPVLATLARRFGEGVVKLASQLQGPGPAMVQVIAASTGEPRVLLDGKSRQSVAEIIERWIVEGDWWDTPTRRDYFRVVLGDGQVKHLYRESGDGGPWFADRSTPLL